MYRERLSISLLRELYELEEAAYRTSLREVSRIGWGPPAAALRAVVAHAYEALECLPALAAARHVRLDSLPASFAATLAASWRRVREIVGQEILAPSTLDHERSYRRVLSTLRKGIDLVHLAQAAAANEGDDELADWCARWQETRERLVEAAAAELDWFACHPFFARTAVPATI